MKRIADLLRTTKNWMLGHKLRAAILALALVFTAPWPAKAQFGLDPCCALLVAGLSSIQSALTKVVGGGLNQILGVDQAMQQFQQAVVWPQNLINQARNLVFVLQGNFNQIQNLMHIPVTRIEIDGVRYSLVGASGSAKNGKFYAVESSFEKKLGERFRFSPQAAITYFGILVSSCKVLVEDPDCRVMVVDDHEFGTNDCRGWISQSLFRKLQQKHQSELLARETERLHAQRIGEGSEEQQEHPLTDEEETALVEQVKRRIHGRKIGAHRFYQFRLAFDKTQAKGAFKVMADEVARHLEADIILPRSCVKPKYQGKVFRTIRSLMGDRQAHTFRGPVMVGFRDVSRNLEFNSSYTLLEHAPEDSIELEIKPYALSQIEKVRQAFEANHFTDL